MVEIFFIDYGNKATISIDNIFRSTQNHTNSRILINSEAIQIQKFEYLIQEQCKKGDTFLLYLFSVNFHAFNFKLDEV